MSEKEIICVSNEVNKLRGKLEKELEEESIYQKLAQATARAIDINLGSTTLAELLDGYTKYIVLQDRIDKAIEYIKPYRVIEHNIGWIEFTLENKIELLEILGDKE